MGTGVASSEGALYQNSFGALFLTTPLVTGLHPAPSILVPPGQKSALTEMICVAAPRKPCGEYKWTHHFNTRNELLGISSLKKVDTFQHARENGWPSNRCVPSENRYEEKAIR
ncbi:hypothetical protein TNCV_2881971 [Trichonephila clavipes]|nr:hypothetical protein TNCV_2881971 [Trichonephila clavipes]